MKEEIKEILNKLKQHISIVSIEDENLLLYCITNLQEENKIKDTNWESLKYYLEKLYYKDYIEEAISDDIDRKIKELESKVEIKGYQKDIKALQEENEELKTENEKLTQLWLDSQEKRRKAIEYLEQPYRDNFDYSKAQLLNILKGDKDDRLE